MSPSIFSSVATVVVGILSYTMFHSSASWADVCMYVHTYVCMYVCIKCRTVAQCSCSSS